MGKQELFDDLVWNKGDEIVQETNDAFGEKGMKKLKNAVLLRLKDDDTPERAFEILSEEYNKLSIK